MRVTGTIPEEITIVSSVEQPVYRQWEGEDFADEIDEEEGEVIKYDERREMVIPAFPIEAGNKKTLKTAIEWAENHRHWYDPETKKHLKKSDPVVQDTRKNTPITGIQVVALEERGNGGRAYKVRTPDKYYFDMREDVMLDTMVTEGIAKGGILNGEFIFGRVGSQMKLVRVGSELHKALLDAVVTNNTKPLDKATFQVGDVLENKSGKQKVFCGWVSTGSFSHFQKVKEQKPSTTRHVYVDQFSYKAMPKAMLWVGTWVKFGDKNYDQYITDAFKNNYRFDVSTTHTFIKKVGNVDELIPDRIIQTVAGRAKSQLKTVLNRVLLQKSTGYYKYEDPNGNEITETAHEIMRHLANQGKLALMVPMTNKFEIDDEFKKHLNLVTK